MQSRHRFFVMKNPPIIPGSKVGEDPQEFPDGMYKVFSVIWVTYREKVEVASYQLMDVSLVWYTQWKANRQVESGPIELEEIKQAFLVMYFPRERREVKVHKFINHKLGNISLKENPWKFTMLSKYVTSLVFL